MILKKLKIKNIRSYENEEIVFPQGNTLLAGEIGSGKTSILLAIEYALFGLQPGQTGSALLRSDSEMGEVVLEIESQGKEIIIERKLKRGKTVVNDYSSYSINGEKVECSITELKSKIIDLLGYPREFIKKNNILYKYTIYTPQEQMKQIILEDPDTRLNILRHIFGVEKYRLIRENVQVLVSKLKEDSKVILGEISSIDFENNRLKSTISFIDILKEKILVQEKNVVEIRNERKKVESSFSEIEENIKKKQNFENNLEKQNVLLRMNKDNLSSIVREKASLQKQLRESQVSFDQKELDSISERLNKVNLEIETLSSRFIENNSQIKSLELIKSQMLSEKERIFKIDMCPTCLQDVPSSHKHNILNKTEGNISSINNQITSLKERSISYPPMIEKLKIEKSGLEKNKMSLQIIESKIPESERLKVKLSDTEKLEKSLSEGISLLETGMASLKESILSYSKFQNLSRITQEDLRKAFNEEKKAEILLAELKKEEELTKKEVSILETSIKEKEEKRKKYIEILEIIDWLVGNFIGLISYTEKSVMFRLRNDFSNQFNKWFSLLVQDNFDARLDENFTPIMIQNGSELDYSFLSGGERTAVALAYRLALNQTINSIMTAIKTKDIIILDEPTEGFSDNQINKLRDILIELNAKQLIIVSHEQKIEGFVDNVIKIKKDNNVSKIESSSD